MNRSALLLWPAGRLVRAASLALGLALAAAVTSVGTAGAAPAALPSNCTQAGTTFTCTFTAAGESRFTVPFGVTSVAATAVGAQGGMFPRNGASGGLGAQATGTFSVTRGQTLYVEVDVLGGAGGTVAGLPLQP
ncbi:MAG: hypothetical protein L0H59_19535, partial [Tomitella sp.]|nr:hypothetical protein [Tomitella sp.]